MKLGDKIAKTLMYTYWIYWFRSALGVGISKGRVIEIYGPESSGKQI